MVMRNENIPRGDSNHHTSRNRCPQAREQQSTISDGRQPEEDGAGGFVSLKPMDSIQDEGAPSNDSNQ